MVNVRVSKNYPGSCGLFVGNVFGTIIANIKQIFVYTFVRMSICGQQLPTNARGPQQTIQHYQRSNEEIYISSSCQRI